MRKRFLKYLAALPVTACVTPAFAQEEAGQQLDVIVVTATKRSENLQDIPVSVSAIGERGIGENRIFDVTGIGNLAPNVTVTRQSGGNSSPQFAIRGVVAGNTNSTTDNGVALYLDGVYIGRSVGSVFDLGDIERIEVLRGPQGTLFGRNSTGGAVSLITPDPSGQLGVNGEVSIGNYHQRRVKLTFSTPEWHALSARITYVHNERDGDVDNLGAGARWDFSSYTGGLAGTLKAADTLGAINSEALLAAVRFEPSSAFKLVYKYDMTRSQSSAPATGVLYDPLGQVAARGGAGTITLTRPDAINNWATTQGFINVDGHNLTATVTPVDNLVIKNIFGYRRVHNRQFNQLDGAGGLVSIAPDPTPGNPYVLLAVPNEGLIHQYSNETTISADLGAVDLIAGYFYYLEKSRRYIGGPSSVIFSEMTVAPDGSFVVPGNPVPRNHVRNRSDAVFAQATFHLNESLDLTGGLRKTWDNRAFEVIGGSLKSKSSKVTWQASLSYKWHEGLLVYGRVATGFISGGISGTTALPVPFKPEEALSYEAGIKADLFDRKVQVNAALFLAKYKNLQFPTFISGISVQKNAGRSRAKGGEIEITALPTPGLKLSGSLGYTDFKFTELDPAIGTLADFYPTGRPKWTATAAGQYDVFTFDWGGTFSLSADLQYRSRYNTLANPSGVTQAIKDKIRDLTVSPATTLLNGRISLSDIPLHGAIGRISIWGRNLTDRKGVISATELGSAFGFPISGLYQPARTYGIDFQVKY